MGMLMKRRTRSGAWVWMLFVLAVIVRFVMRKKRCATLDESVGECCMLVWSSGVWRMVMRW